MGSVELFFLFLLQLNKPPVDLAYIDLPGWSWKNSTLCWTSMEYFSWGREIGCDGCVTYLKQCLSQSIGGSVCLLVGILDLLYHWLDETIRLMEVRWRCGMNEIKVTGKLSKFLTIEWGTIVRHDDGRHSFSCKRVHVGGWWSWNDDWMPLERRMGTYWSNLPLLDAFFPNGLERSWHLFLPKVREGPHGVQRLHW